MNNGASLHGRAVAAEAVEPVPVSPVPASIPSATVKESVGDVTLFSVRNGWEWGDIFVRPSKDGAEVVAHSSFGTFGYNWIAMGGDWREFLLSCSREYAMRKLAGHFYDAPLSHDEFVAAMRKELDDYEESVIDAWGILDPDQERRIKLCRDALDDDWGWEDVPVEALFWHFNERASGAPYALELYETRMTKINPQVVGFWETIWEPFGDYLAQAIEARRAETTGTVEDESAVRKDAP